MTTEPTAILEPSAAESLLNIDSIKEMMDAIYGTNGTLVAEQYGNGYVALPSGIYVVKVDGHSAKMYVK